MALVNSSGTSVASYSYDPYGRVVSSSGTLATTNPLRYRGYYQDTETGFYYLQSRYYDPAICRFINADAYASTGQGILGHNMYANCGNSPVTRYEVQGLFWDTILDIVSLCFSVAEVIENPDDPTAWLGLAADAASLLIPGVTGGGTIVRAASAADDIIDTTDAVVDLVKASDNIVEVIDAVDDIGDSINVLTDGIQYTEKVRRQMMSTSDLRHAFPTIIDTMIDIRSGTSITGGDGVVRTLIQIPGSINGKDGVFEYIIEPNGWCNHRFFKELKK